MFKYIQTSSTLLKDQLSSSESVQNDSRVDGAIHFAIVRDLRPFAPDHLSARRDQAQLADVDLDDGPLREDPQLRRHWALRVFLHLHTRGPGGPWLAGFGAGEGERREERWEWRERSEGSGERGTTHRYDRQQHRDAQFRMRDVRFLVPQPHRPDEAFILDGSPGEIGANERRLGDHALPALLGRLPARLDHLEHLLVRDAAHPGQRDGELGGRLAALVLDRAGQRLRGGRVGPVEQVFRLRVGGGRVRGGGLDVALLVRLDLLLHLDLLHPARLLVQFGPQAAQVLRIVRLLVALAR